MHDGSHLRLRKLDHTYDATDKIKAIEAIQEAHNREEVLTGVLYVQPGGKDFLELIDMIDEPLATLPQERTRPPQSALDTIMEELR